MAAKAPGREGSDPPESQHPDGCGINGAHCSGYGSCPRCGVYEKRPWMQVGDVAPLMTDHP